MEKSELRIGSIYMSEKFNMPVYLEADDICQMVQDADGADIEPEGYIKPIPLSENWLEKFGFKQWGDKYTWSVKGLIIHKRKRGFVVRKSMPIITSVHQLQSLYYAMTCKEIAPFVSGVWKGC